MSGQDCLQKNYKQLQGIYIHMFTAVCLTDEMLLLVSSFHLPNWQYNQQGLIGYIRQLSNFIARVCRVPMHTIEAINQIKFAWTQLGMNQKRIKSKIGVTKQPSDIEVVQLWSLIIWNVVGFIGCNCMYMV